MDDPRPTDIPLAVLTPRERVVLQLAADGLSTPAIAEDLSVSRATVRTHFGNIYLKLNVRSRAGAVAKGMRLGLIT
jgi:DNA-binding NarL/FixJ family response regulator